MIEIDTSERCQVTEEQNNWLATQPPKLEKKKKSKLSNLQYPAP